MMIQYKTIGNISAELLFQLHQIGQPFFTIEQASHLLKARDLASTRRLLADMVRRGLLMRLMNGLYHIIPYESDPNNYFPNWHVAAHYLAGTTPYYIGYYSAMIIHDLTTQPSFIEQIVVSKPVQPTQQVAKDVSFQYIWHNPQHFFGFTQQWIENIYQVYCSDLEKTLLDIAFKPHYGGGAIELGKALFKSKDNLDKNRLLNYIDQFKSDAVIRRLGFLMESLNIHLELVQQLYQKLPKTATYVALDTGLPKIGRSISRWGIVLNIDLATITNAHFS
jgi:predicted transcriptional regulator of viral defense system